MAFRFEPSVITDIGKKKIKTMVGGDFDFAKCNVKDSILSQYNSIESLKEKAVCGQDWKVQSDLGMVYQYGIPELNIEKDFDSAIGWYESSIQNGNRLSAFRLNLATLHDLKGTVPHQRRAHELYLQAARLGEAQAELNLAESYRCGVEGVVNEDLEEAFIWYRRAAGEESLDHDEYDKDESINPSVCLKGTLRHMHIDLKLTALRSLHKYYMSGDCPERKPQPIKALYYLKKAAELGDSVAQKDLGLSYLTGGSGQPKDLDKAKRWLGKAANSGDQEAKEVLKKLVGQDIVDIVQPETGQPDILKSSLQQYFDISKMNMEQNQQQHPYVIQNHMIFQESMFTQYPDSPTAQHYLKAFRLVKKGIDELHSSSFMNPEGITLIAHGVLYENSITQSFPSITMSENFLPSLFGLIYEQLKINSNFFEGLLLIVKLYPMKRKLSLESSKLDLRKIMSLNNLIHLIKIAEPNMPPKEDPYNFEQDYSSWLHVLYYYLASHYVITECFKDGADAFQESLHCCPRYYEAKVGLAYCLMDMAASREQQQDASNPDEELLETFEAPKNQRIPKGDYLSWTQEELRQKAKQLFMEYIQEAPECDKKYPNCHYHLAVLYMLERDMQEAVKWKERGEDAEEKRLPFMAPVDAGSKKNLAFLDMLPIPKNEKRCSNRKCPKKRRDKVTLKPCPCHKVSYCGSECQAADWKEHKKTCSYKKKKGKSPE